MKKSILIPLLLFILMTSNLSFAADDVKVTYTSFSVTLNQTPIINKDIEYPLIVYKDITYFPMTYTFANALSLDIQFTQENGLMINRSDKAGSFIALSNAYYNHPSVVQYASLPGYKITVNGKSVDNASETYPLLNYKGITYFPLTYNWAVNTFDWTYQFSHENGLNISSLEMQPVDTVSSDRINAPLNMSLQLPSVYSFYTAHPEINRSQFIRDQGEDNTCWAFAANTLFELSLYHQEGAIVDLSEDDLISGSPIPADISSGGYFTMAHQYYLLENTPINTDTTLPLQYQLGNTFVITDDLQAIKRAIYQYGAVLSSIYLPQDLPYDTTHYETTDKSTIINHDVVLIGWDDAKSAFIAQNSWGLEWGNQGTFYISYSDIHVTKETKVIGSFKVRQANTELISYTPTGITHYEGYSDFNYATGMNRFTLNKPGILKNIQFYLGNDATRFTLYFLPNPKDSNNMILLTSGKAVYSGYYQYDLEQVVNLEANKSFGIAIKYENDTTTFLIPIEAPYPNIDYPITSQLNESFISLNPSQWGFSDINDFYDSANVGINIEVEYPLQ